MIVIERTNMIANLDARMQNILTLLNFFIRTLQKAIIKQPNPEIAKLKNGLKQSVIFSFKTTLFFSSSFIFISLECVILVIHETESNPGEKYSTLEIKIQLSLFRRME